MERETVRDNLRIGVAGAGCVRERDQHVAGMGTLHPLQ